MSVATISRVINNSESVRPSTRQKVLAVMKEHNYVPSATARDLSFRRSEVVAVVVPEPEEPFLLRPDRGNYQGRREKQLSGTDLQYQ